MSFYATIGILPALTSIYYETGGAQKTLACSASTRVKPKKGLLVAQLESQHCLSGPPTPWAAPVTSEAWKERLVHLLGLPHPW